MRVQGVTEQSWRGLIETMLDARAALEAADAEDLWEFPGPRDAASEGDLAAVERHLGQPLPAEFRGFLAEADGWPRFFLGLDLFGTRELASGVPDSELGGWSLAQRLDDTAESLNYPYALERYATWEALCARPFAPRDLVLMALQRDGADMMFFLAEGHPAAGAVVWIAGALVEIWPDFRAAFERCIELTRGQAAELGAA